MKKSFTVWLIERLRKPDAILPYLRSDWEGTKNPYFVWEAIDICNTRQWELPDWVRAYLVSCARRMMSEDAVQASDLRKILPEVLGFPRKRGPGNLLKPDGDVGKYFSAAVMFAVEIEKGAEPSAALRTASEYLDKEVADKIDDKTLRGHIRKLFGVKNAPRTNADWQREIGAWYATSFGQIRKEYRELSP
jgi:hypothetical protein